MDDEETSGTGTGPVRASIGFRCATPTIRPSHQPSVVLCLYVCLLYIPTLHPPLHRLNAIRHLAAQSTVLPRLNAVRLRRRLLDKSAADSPADEAG